MFNPQMDRAAIRRTDYPAMGGSISHWKSSPQVVVQAGLDRQWLLIQKNKKNCENFILVLFGVTSLRRHAGLYRLSRLNSIPRSRVSPNPCYGRTVHSRFEPITGMLLSRSSWRLYNGIAPVKTLYLLMIRMEYLTLPNQTYFRVYLFFCGGYKILNLFSSSSLFLVTFPYIHTYIHNGPYMLPKLINKRNRIVNLCSVNKLQMLIEHIRWFFYIHFEFLT